MSNIKFSAQGDWTVTDLQNFFHQLNILYNRLYVIDDLNSDSKAKLTNILNTSLSRVPEYDQLLVDYIEIHSPAKFSLKGGDKIIGQVRSFIKDVWYDNKLEKKKKEQELEHQEKLNDLEIADKHTDLINKQIGILRDVGYSDEDIQKNIKKLTDPVNKISSIMYEKDVKLLDEDKNT
jgi:hypothetical protein